jgi:hypothetical protein
MDVAGQCATFQAPRPKVRSRDTLELVLGAVIGSISRPESVVAGVARDGVLVIAGRSVPLTASQSASLAPVLTPAGTDHPWPDTIVANRLAATAIVSP